MAKWKLPAALFAAAVAVAGVAVVGGTAAIAQAQTATAAAGSAGTHPAGAVASGGTWSSAIPVPGLLTVDGLTCTSPGNCVAVGLGTAFGAGVATERNGVWHAAQGYTAGTTNAILGGVDGVACSSQGNCVAWGVYPTPWVVLEENGAWGSAGLLSVGGVTTFKAISCSPNGYCAAVGQEVPNPNDAVTDGLVVAESGGTWGTPETIPAPSPEPASNWPYFSLDRVSCTASGDCIAGGIAYNGGNDGWQEDVGGLVTETNGVWGAATLVPGVPSASGGQVMDNSIGLLSCQAPGDCTTAGTYDVWDWSPGTTVASGSFIITEASGVWQPAVLIPASGGGYAFSSVSCSSIGNCVITGEDTSDADPVAVDVVNGSVTGTLAVLAGSAGLNIDNSSSLVSCAPTGYCAVLGSYYSGQSSDQVFVAVNTAVGWDIRLARGIPQGSSISAVSCTATGFCTAAGSDVSGAFAVDEATASATVLKISRPEITYGHEQTEHVTVDVTSHYANALTGTVTIKKGSVILAVLTLKSGEASYSLTVKRLNPGSYALTATYAGNAAYLGSTSAAVKIKVVK